MGKWCKLRDEIPKNWALPRKYNDSYKNNPNAGQLDEAGIAVLIIQKEDLPQGSHPLSLANSNKF
jgi:hypothetical protein